jgi:hypothetical protein
MRVVALVVEFDSRVAPDTGRVGLDDPAHRLCTARDTAQRAPWSRKMVPRTALPAGAVPWLHRCRVAAVRYVFGTLTEPHFFRCQ